ncbi:MAG: TetR/AcrR family transcriptional regulator [Deltaproteobacteria bacterium]|nr:TetR/AcrR family transcriptional regulator [Deltaproteobacteria bacterium]
MAGLRERKKEKRKHDIIKIAERLFREQGFPETAMETIAEKVDVSPATVYNYFPTKADLLFEILRSLDENMMRFVEAELKKPLKDPVEAVCRFLNVFVTSGLEHIGKDTYRHVIANMFVKQDHNFNIRVKSLNALLIEQIAAILEQFKGRGVISVGANTQLAADILWKLHRALFFEYLQSDEMSFKQYKSANRKYVNAVIKGLL